MSSPLIPRGRGAYQAFTLIELLTVIAIIGILAGVTFSVMGGVKRRSSIQKAQSELAMLSQALEQYKRQYGDYPQTGVSVDAPDVSPTASNGQSLLFNALMGKLGPKAKNAATPSIDGKAFVDATNFHLSNTSLPTPGNTTSVTNAFVDPWGRLYLYYYRDSTAYASWKASSYVLYSVGPDGIHAAPSTIAASYGTIDYTDPANKDNIYANR